MTLLRTVIRQKNGVHNHTATNISKLVDLILLLRYFDKDPRIFQIKLFWDMTPCSFVHTYPPLEQAATFLFIPKIRLSVPLKRL